MAAGPVESEAGGARGARGARGACGGGAIAGAGGAVGPRGAEGAAKSRVGGGGEGPSGCSKNMAVVKTVLGSHFGRVNSPPMVGPIFVVGLGCSLGVRDLFNFHLLVALLVLKGIDFTIWTLYFFPGVLSKWK